MEDFNNHQEHDETSVAAANNNSHGWQKVTYAKRRKNQQQNNKPKPAGASASVDDADDKDGNVFRAIEKQSEDRHRRIVEAQRKAAALVDSQKPRSKRRDDSDDTESDEERENVAVNEPKEEKKKKKKVEKKPKLTVAEAAAKIDASDLAAFLLDVSGSYGSQEDIQLMRFADYFGRSFSGVGAAQFPWVKTFRESPVAKLAEVPLSHVPDAVYKTSADWINQRSVTALNSFVLLLIDSILTDLGNQLVSAKNAKKGTQQPSSKSQVAVFVVLAMVLRRKPDVLVSILPTLRENSKYHGQDKLPITIWMICQACQGDLAVGLYAWAHNLLPLLNSKSSNNPLTRDLILQLIESRIMAAPKARSILVNGAVRKGERLIPPAELEILMRATFPVSSARVKATERFEAVYPTLKEIALAGVPGSKAMKQVSLQIFGYAIIAAGEENPELSKEATGIVLWCLSQNREIYKHWDKVYLDNLKASVAILKKLSEEWREHVNHSSHELLKQTIKSFQHKNEKALAEEDSAQQALLRDADKYCKVLYGRLSRSHGCLKGLAVIAVACAVGAAVVSPDMSIDWNRLAVMKEQILSSFQSV